VTQSQVYDYGNLTTPARTFNFTYLGGTNYTSRYIFNRMTTAMLTAGGTRYGLAQNTYDEPIPALTLGPPAAMDDDANYGTGMTYRGNVTTKKTPGGSSTFEYYTTGVVKSSTGESGVAVNNTVNSSTNYSLPSVLTPGGDSNMATSIGYTSSWAVASVIGANGANSTTTYDDWGRPLTSKIPDGAQTTYTYTMNTQTATLGTRWTKTTLDGFGRTVKVETGHDGVTPTLVAETEYAPCACSPLGKLKRTSRPHAPNAVPLWTTYTYDGRGRTLTVTLPDGSVTAYLYQGNTTKVTDAAGKWKKQTTDAMGDLILVTEPNPAGGADWTTSYTYDVMNHLTGVDMPRPYPATGTFTQHRTFQYAAGSTWVGIYRSDRT
jgi:hypothetical protein